MFRLCESYKQVTKGTTREPPAPSVIAVMDLGFHTVMGGDGPIYESFKRRRTFGEYSGRGIRPKLPEEDNFSRTRMRELKFEHCFKTCRESITKRKYHSFHICTEIMELSHLHVSQTNEFLVVLFHAFSLHRSSVQSRC